MYIKTRNVRIKQDAIEAIIPSGTVITFHLVSGSEVSIDYGSTEAVNVALDNLDSLIELSH